MMPSLFLCLHLYYTTDPQDWAKCAYCCFIQTRVYLGMHDISTYMVTNTYIGCCFTSKQLTTVMSLQQRRETMLFLSLETRN